MSAFKQQLTLVFHISNVNNMPQPHISIEEPDEEHPIKEWVCRLEKIFLLHPSFFGRSGDRRYHFGFSIANLSLSLASFRWFIGAFFPSFGLLLGNYFNVLGVAGQITSFAAGAFTGLMVYFHCRLLSERDLSFVNDLTAYSVKETGNRTILTGKHREELENFMKTSWSNLQKAESFTLNNFRITIFLLSFVTPLSVQGVTLENVLFWGGFGLLLIPVVYYIPMNWVHVIGVWFFCKSHLDIQTDFIIEKMEQLLCKSKNAIASQIDAEIYSIDKDYRHLVSRIKIFDQLSKDLISPYRFILSYFCGIMAFGAHAQSSVAFQVGMDLIVAIHYICSLVFLFTACSLSIRRKRMYILANTIFNSVSNHVKTPGDPVMKVSQMIILRRWIKSLGSTTLPSICLTDTSGKEFEPMEFVEFILETFSNFTLAANLYTDYFNQ